MVTLPTDRGYVVLRDTEDSAIQIDVYLEHPEVGASPFARHSHEVRPIMDATAEFVPFDGGVVSTEPLEVRWSEADRSVHIGRASSLAI